MGKLFRKFQEKVSSLFSSEAKPAPKADAPRFAIKRAYTNEPLTDADRMDLAELRASAGYAPLLSIMERTCEGFTTSLIKTDPADESGIVAAHRVAHSAWLFYESVQRQVETEISIVDAALDESREVNRLMALADEMPNMDDPEAVARLNDPLYIPRTPPISAYGREMQKLGVVRRTPLDVMAE